MKKLHNILYIAPMCMIFSCDATPLAPDVAIANARMHCDTISQSFKSMKTMAQVNTAVTGVGTAVGAGATIAGIAKASTDRQIEKLIHDVRQRETMADIPAPTIDDGQDFIDSTMELVHGTTKNDGQKNKLEQRSKNLGNLRTGLLATNTATNVAGTIIAANNRTNQDLRTQLDNCVKSIRDLQDSRMQAQINNADPAVLQRMDNIITACREYDTLDVGKIDSKATGAAISSGVGIAVGTAGTITSAAANSDSVRNGDDTREKNLNTASNVLAAGATVTSGIATVFNAQQISTLNTAKKIATQCSEALNQ